MDVLSPGQRPLREELHACDSGLQPCHSRLPIPETVLDWLNDNPDSLLLAEVQIDRWLQNALSEDGFGYLLHGHLP